ARYFESGELEESEEELVSLGGLYARVQIGLMEREENKPLRRWNIDMSNAQVTAGKYLVFKDTEHSDYFPMANDFKITTTPIWLVKHKSLRIQNEVNVLERCDEMGGGWRDFEALLIEPLMGSDIDFDDPSTGRALRIPVRFSAVELARLSSAYLLDGVTWAASPVYTRLPTLQLPEIEDLSRFSVTLVEDGNGKNVETLQLDQIAEKHDHHLRLKLTSFNNIRVKEPGKFRLILRGKLGEYKEIQFAYIPGFDLSFKEDYYLPDCRKRTAQFAEALVTYEGEGLPKIEESIPVSSTDIPGQFDVKVPGDCGYFHMILPFDEGNNNAVISVRVPRLRFRIEGLDVEKAEGSNRFGWQTGMQVIELEEIQPGTRVRIESPTKSDSMSLHLEKLGIKQYRPTPRKSAVFNLAAYYDTIAAAEIHISHLVLEMISQKETIFSMPILAVQKGWRIEGLKRKVIKEAGIDYLDVTWNENMQRDLGQVLLWKKSRPWEEPTQNQVLASQNSCKIPFPGGKAVKGEYGLYFSLVDEWYTIPQGLPFQNLPNGTGLKIEVTGVEAGQDQSDALSTRLDEATTSLIRHRQNPFSPRRASSTAFPISIDTNIEGIKRTVITYLYWRIYLQRKGIPHEKLVDGLKNWCSIYGNDEKLKALFNELAEKGGMIVARELKAFWTLLHEQEFQPPFRAGELLKHKKNGRIYRYVEVSRTTAGGVTRLMMRMENLSEDIASYLPIDDVPYLFPAGPDDIATKPRRGRGRKRK
ncbi:MAG: hypothetical protein AB1861_28595, partial [Cyanobacteriota bacterium]